MIIPVRCMTCGKVLADKYDWYIAEVAKHTKKEAEKREKADREGKEPTKKKAAEEHELRHFDQIRTGHILDKLGLVRPCCRRDMMTTVDMMAQI